MSNSDPDETRLIRRSNPPAPAGSPAPRPTGTDSEDTIYVNAPGARSAHGEPDGTRIVDRRAASGPGAPVSSSQPPDQHTVLVRPSSRGQQKSTASDVGAVSESFLPEGPVVGWLVVIRGPGKGRSVTLGYGMNPIGRDADNRVSLPFGDEQISRKKHATITYDPRGNKFYLQHGESSNLTYIGETPVLAPTLLSGGETIRLGGDTEVRFVPLCGEDFEWEGLE